MLVIIIIIIIIALRITHDEVVGHHINWFSVVSVGHYWRNIVQNLSAISICKAKYLAYSILAKVSDKHILAGQINHAPIY